jgi:uncharacterized protein (DUF427 family)
VPKATWNGVTVAESPNTVMVEGNHYFPPDSVDRSLLRPSDRTSICPWKGTASYFDVVVEGKVNSAAAWTYPEPKEKASQIRDHIAFWGGVEVTA